MVLFLFYLFWFIAGLRQGLVALLCGGLQVVLWFVAIYALFLLRDLIFGLFPFAFYVHLLKYLFVGFSYLLDIIWIYMMLV